MVGLVLRGLFRPDAGDEVIRVSQESIATFRQQEGFQSVTYLYDRASGIGLAFTLWDNEAHVAAARDWLQTFAQQIEPLRLEPGAPLEAIGAHLPIFEVVAQG